MKHYAKGMKNLIGLDQSRKKQGLWHTLLLIGLVLGFGATAMAQTGAPDGLQMKKTYTPTSNDGSEGYITLETFVTGSMVTVTQSIPCDVVIVASMSSSMNDNLGTQKKDAALQAAATAFVNTLQNDDLNQVVQGNYHRVATCMFSSDGQNNPAWNHTQLNSAGSNSVHYGIAGPSDYHVCLRNINTDWSGSYITRFSAPNNTAKNYMQYGLDMALQIFNNRGNNQIDTQYQDITGEWNDRGMVVIFLSDGLPGGYADIPSNNKGSFYNGTRPYDQQTVADATVAKAHDLKQLGATIFSIGIFNGADENAAFQTTAHSLSGNQGGSTMRWSDEIQACNGLMHFISSNYPDATSWSDLTTSPANTAYKFPDSKYLTASDATQLGNIFTSIAAQVGGSDVTMTMESVVQDIISTNFKLPEGANTNITAYAPLCTGKNGDTYLFENINDEGELSIYNGVVVPCEEGISGCGENKLPNSLITIVDKTVQFTGLNMGEMWCGMSDNTPHGRKLVIKIPIVVEEGVWGDAMATNEYMSVILPDGNSVEPIGYFDIPYANVLGSVWTEVVTHEPVGYNDTIIDSPEDLAWFISRVNGRIHYEENNTIPSNPKLNGKLTADIDMSAHNWVPIGAGFKCNDNNQFVDADGNPVDERTIKLAYEGVFDGNGHVITGLKNNAAKFYKLGYGETNDVAVYPGMFSNVKGDGETTGIVKNVFVLDADFRARNHANEPYATFIHFGIIADTLTGGSIYNCEAVGCITNTYDADNYDNDKLMIFGGLVGLNNGGTIHSSMAMPVLTGYTMGGMIGENRGPFYNGFTNGVYHYLGTTNDYKVGGIAGKNTTAGSIKNCYVRFSRDINTGLNTNNFRQIVGDGTFTTTSCYSPISTYGSETLETTAPFIGQGIEYTTTCNPSRMRQDRSNDNMVGGAWDVTQTDVTLYLNGKPLVDELNNNSDRNGGAEWKRTTAGGYSTSPNGGNINGDYPVLKFAEYKCLASAMGIGIDYAPSLNEMLKRHNTGEMNANTQLPGIAGGCVDPNNTHVYEVTAAPAIYGGAINLYANEDMSSATDNISTNDNVMVYIDENISLLQPIGSSITAYTGQTIAEYGASYDDIQAGNRWHNVSSSLQNSMFGLTYGIETQVPFSWDSWESWGGNDSNPCEVAARTDNDDEAIFPSDMMSFHPFDFYCFFEPEYHWINFRRNNVSHWHMDYDGDDIPANHDYIDYVYQDYVNGEFVDVHANEDHFIPGKGYLLALHTMYFDNWHQWYGDDGKDRQFLQNRGKLNNGEISIPVTCTPGIGWTGRQGYNLLGNPYQSYLDFDAFAVANETLLNAGAFGKTYAVYDPELDAWRQYMSGSSKCSHAIGTRYLNMHQGFFIQVMNSGTVTFDNSMRTNDPGDDFEGFRGEQNNYPLVNFTLTDMNGNKEIAVLEVGRPEDDGAKKIFVSTSKGRLYLHHNNENFAILFRDLESGSQPLYFDAKEDGVFTLSWNTANANFQSLFLVDNITGVKYDMLIHDSYEFEGHVSDYSSRFKILVGAFSDVEEEAFVPNQNFAFFDGSEWVVNGQGSLIVVDMMGRVVYNTTLANDQNRVSIGGLAQGVYLMRVIDGNNVKNQKVIIK